MDITTEARDKGLYIIRAIGDLKWTENDGTWQAPGVRLDLMDGPRRLAVCKLEVAASKAEERAAPVATGIQTWAKTLQALAIVDELRSQLGRVDSLMLQVEDEQASGCLEPTTVDEMLGLAQQDEVDSAQTAGGRNPLGLPLGRLVAARLRRQISRGLRLALAHAPSPVETPIHPAWEQPALAGMSGEPTVQYAARNLLAAWADVRDARDSLITWAVKDAEVERTTVQQLTGVARTTINRLLPD